MEIERFDIVHLRVIGGLFEVFRQLKHAEMRFAVGPVVLFGRTDGNAGDEIFAFEFVPARAVGKTIGEYAVEILFKNGGHIVPIERILEHDGLMTQQRLLFGFNIDTV